jgi:hypothetical protein
MGKQKKFGAGLNALLGSEDRETRHNVINNTAVIKKSIAPQEPKNEEDVPSSKRGLKPNYSRGSFIMDEVMLDRLKALAYWKRKKISAVLHKALEDYCSNLNPDEIRRAEDAYRQRNDDENSSF